MRISVCSLLFSCGICANLSAQIPERLIHRTPPEVIAERVAVDAHIARIRSEFGDNAPSELYKLLEENPRNLTYLSRIMDEFWPSMLDPTAEGDAEVIKMMRATVDAYPKNLGVVGCATMYLTLKGDASDLERLRNDADILSLRVSGTNLFEDNSERHYRNGIRRRGGYTILTIMDMFGRLSKLNYYFIPSVANTGPQALYVYDILKSYWEQNGKDDAEIPAELLTMVVWFDEEGKPVCNVDLSKYGLIMPELDVPNKPKPKDRVEVKASPPNREPKAKPSSVSRETDGTEAPPPNRAWLYIALLALAVISGAVMWRKAKRKYNAKYRANNLRESM